MVALRTHIKLQHTQRTATHTQRECRNYTKNNNKKPTTNCVFVSALRHSVMSVLASVCTESSTSSAIANFRDSLVQYNTVNRT